MPEKRIAPPDNAQRESALDATRSVLVRAPAGSGKTDLLTRRFLLLLGEVVDPGEIVAITFTKAAAAEMRHRILAELEKAASTHAAEGAREDAAEAFSMNALARRALARSRALGWNLVDLPAQLRINTIDSFCREIASAEPILSGLGGILEIGEQPGELLRRAARRTIEQIGRGDAALSEAIETLLLWRDNSWKDLEDQIVAMLAVRDRWMQPSFLDRDPNWDLLREQLERPFARAIRFHLAGLDLLFEHSPGAREEAQALARFACQQSAGALHRELAELAEFPAAPSANSSDLAAAQHAYECAAGLLLTGNQFRRSVDKRHGFPANARGEKSRLFALIARLEAEPAFLPALVAVRDLPPARYSDEDWEIVRACFVLLRRAAAELRVVFAETGKADFVEMAQMAQRALRGEDNLPGDAAQLFCDRVRHLLVDEFQDTSRRQHQLLAHLFAAWSGREGRTCFVVGDPMQSIYGFRDADAELFPRVEQRGIEISGEMPLGLNAVQLFTNFRTATPLVHRLNHVFGAIFAEDDGCGMVFAPAAPARGATAHAERSHGDQGPRLVEDASSCFGLHLAFMPARFGHAHSRNANEKESQKNQRDEALQQQLEEIVALVRGYWPRVEEARASGGKFRIAILGRARTALAPVAQALREAAIAFRAVELEPLRDRPEILDALSLARALCNPQDRVAWLGVLRAPWCGLSLADLHLLTSADDENLKMRAIPDLLAERARLLSEEGRAAVARVADAVGFAVRLQATQPTAALGTRVEQIWLRLGGAQCVDAAAGANLDLLWRALDGLPQGEADLLGPALNAALDSLKALPDPKASADCGVQLMTMHGAKGLEFEVVIVPELQAGPGQNRQEMLSWLERGLPAESSSAGEEEITEFLVAPFSAKGADRGSAKSWVDRVRRERERQEMRRIFYVAATRAREELHLFARLEVKAAADGSPALVEPRESLLKTAWPALRDEVECRFDAWCATAHPSEPSIIESLAASAETVLTMNASAPANLVQPVRLRRLPSGFQMPRIEGVSSFGDPPMGAGNLYQRHEGGVLARAFGRAVHAFFQSLAQIRARESKEAALALLPQIEPCIAADLRAAGMDVREARRIAAEALAVTLNAAADPVAQWILSPHEKAASEARWSGVIDGRLRTVQVDRVFRSGPEPESSGEDTWWIIDYKTAHEDGLDPAAALSGFRRIFAPQIEAYARILRNLYGESAPVRGGLYYPRMKLFDGWKL